jgi:hypothetical protein
MDLIGISLKNHPAKTSHTLPSATHTLPIPFSSPVPAALTHSDESSKIHVLMSNIYDATLPCVNLIAVSLC